MAVSRITQNMMTRNYLARVNLASRGYDDAMAKCTSGRAFTKMSQNVTDGARALRIRQQLYRNNQLQRNTQTVQEGFSIAENNLKSINEMAVQAHSDILRIQNGVFEQTERDIIATHLEQQMAQIMQSANAIYGDHYVFSGTKNDAAPYSLNQYGELLYNGAPVNDIERVINFAEYYVVDGGTPQEKTYPITWNEDKTEFHYDVVDNTLPGGIRHEVVDRASLQDGDIRKVPMSTSFAYSKAASMVEKNNAFLADGTTGIHRRSDGVYEDDDGKLYSAEEFRNMTILYDMSDDGSGDFISSDLNQASMKYDVYYKDMKNGFYYQVNADDPNFFYDEYGIKKSFQDTYGFTPDLEDPEHPLYFVEKVPYSEDTYIDVGLGMNFSDNGGGFPPHGDDQLKAMIGTKTALNQNSTVKATVSGLEAFGFGVRDITYISQSGEAKHYQVPNNIYLVFEQMSKALRTGNVSVTGEEGFSGYGYDGQPIYSDPNNGGDVAQKYHGDPDPYNGDGDPTNNLTYVPDSDSAYGNPNYLAALDVHMTTVRNNMIKNIAEIGIRDKYLTNNLDKLEEEEITLLEFQKNVESIKEADEFTNLAMAEYAWTLSLQFGKNFIPMSLMDYVV